MTFHINQRVICVDDKITNPRLRGLPLKKGEVYTISAINNTFKHGIHYKLKEIAEFPRVDYWAHHCHFRPLVETDISISQAILADPSKPIEDEEIRTKEGVPVQ